MDGISNAGSFASVRGIIIFRFDVERVHIYGHSAIGAVQTGKKNNKKQLNIWQNFLIL